MAELNNTTHVETLAGQAFSILLVEDDELVRSRLDARLETAGYGVLSVSSCEAARRAVSSLVFPLIIIDHNLEDGHGIELISELRQLCAPNRIFIMLLTGRDSPEEIVRGLEAGADEYLSKISSDEELLARLRSALRIVKLRTR